MRAATTPLTFAGVMRFISAAAVYINNTIVYDNTPVICFNDAGVITDIISKADVPSQDAIEFYDGLLVPGFVNAHCHLELSHMLDVVPRGTGLLGFLKKIIRQRDLTLEDIQNTARNAEQQMYDNGIVAVGDISNTTHTFDLKKEKRLQYHTFIESFSVNPAAANDAFKQSSKVADAAQSVGLSHSITPHAPYSVSEKLFQLIYGSNADFYTIHFEESMAEIDLFTKNEGEFLQFYTDFLRMATIMERKANNIVDYILTGFDTTKRLLLVHNTYLQPADLEKLHNMLGNNLFLCTCPKANLYIENHLPDYALWQSALGSDSDNICVGTDSLSSNNSLDIYDELLTIQNGGKSIPAETLLKWATINGACSLSLDNQLGTLEKDKAPGAVLLPLPNGQALSPGQPKRIL